MAMAFWLGFGAGVFCCIVTWVIALLAVGYDD
jgi:hypothetical protein